MIPGLRGNRFLAWLLLKILGMDDGTHKEDTMKKTVPIALILLVGLALAFPQPGYSWGHRSYGPGPVVGAGAAVVGAAAAVVGTAAAVVGTVIGSPGYGYYQPPAPYAYPAPAYAYPAPAYGYVYPYYVPRYYPNYRYYGYYGGRGHYGHRG